MRRRPAIVAIPARDEADRIEACLAALIVQRDGAGAPLPPGSFEILVLANGCQDATAAAVARMSALSPHPIRCVEEDLPLSQAHAGGARRRAMDLAADRLDRQGRADGVILTTDADSTVSITWVDATLDAFGRGVAGVAGYIDAHPAEIVGLGSAFMDRGRLEDTYLRAVAEIYARCDPRPFDPWPNHRVSSGASLAVTLSAYRHVGGLPAVPVGEDAALTRLLGRAGLRVCHPMSVTVSTSCRLDGRAPGGAADTMRSRSAEPDAPCDADMERALPTLRRAAARGRLRRASDTGDSLPTGSAALRLTPSNRAELGRRLARDSFQAVWDWVEETSPALQRAAPLRPSDLPVEIERADRLLRRLRGEAVTLFPPPLRTGTAPVRRRGRSDQPDGPRSRAREAIEPIDVVVQPIVAVAVR